MRLPALALALLCGPLLTACARSNLTPTVVTDLRLVQRQPLETDCSPEPQAPAASDDAAAASFALAVTMAGRDCRSKFYANLKNQQGTP